MRRRPIGIGALQKDKQKLELFQQKGNILAKDQLEKLASQMDEFRANLEKFASKHKKEIKRNVEFRRYFQSMCAAAGVDPLRSSATFWVRLLGVGDFYYELAIQIVEIFLSTSHNNGGIMSFNELIDRLNKSRNVSKNSRLKEIEVITKSDVHEAIKKLTILGSNIRAEPPDNPTIIHATPAELNPDQLDISQIAYAGQGYANRLLVSQKLGWSDERIQKAFNELSMEGLVWVDDQDPSGETLYWFPSLFESQNRSDRVSV